MGEPTGDWRHGLFSGVCGADSCGLCLGSWCCGCFVHGRTSERLDQFPNEETPGLCNGACWLLCASACCHLQWLVALLKRGDIRKKFDIKGNGCTDCLISWCCFPCALAQMESEVKERAKLLNQNGGQSMGYTPNKQGMVYQQPQQGYYQQQQHPA